MKRIKIKAERKKERKKERFIKNSRIKSTLVNIVTMNNTKIKIQS